MQVILTADVAHLGHMGDIVEVADGYGRNYLIPQSLAIQATAGNRKQFEHIRRTVETKSAQLRERALGTRQQLDGTNITIAKRTGDSDRLYGSVSSREISEALANVGFEVERRYIQLEQHIKELGIYEVSIKLHSDVEATVRVWVVRM